MKRSHIGCGLALALQIASASEAADELPNGPSALAFDDGTVVAVAPCPSRDGALCGVLVVLPGSAGPLEASQRATLCGATILGSRCQ